MTKSPHLLSLPQELLCMAVTELAFADLLKARAACQALRKACSTLQVWRQLLKRSVGITLPKPFFLPKPVEECTARELERAIRTWDAPWVSAAPVQTIRRDAANSLQNNWRFDSRSMVMLPGGRWVLLSHRDRSVWYLDLSQDWTSTAPLEPRLLIPALPLPHGRRIVDGIGVTLAVDWTSEDALGSPSSSSAACQLTLTRFNIAVFVCHVSSNPSNRKVTRVNVHNVQVHYNHNHDRDGSDGARLCLGEHLSSFEDAQRGGVESASLHGSMLAYTSACKHQVSLVDWWRKVHGKTVDEALPGRCIAHYNVTSIRLIPGNLILVGSESKDKARFFLHDWAKDYPLRDISSSHDDETCSTSCALQPFWRFKAPYASIPAKLASTQQQPLVVQGDIVRLVLPTAGGVYGLAISIPGGGKDNEDYASDDEGQGEFLVTVKLIPLVKSAKFKSIVEKPPPIFTLDRAVGFARGRWDKQRRSNSEMFFARYTWPKDEDTDTGNTETETDLAYETKNTSSSTSPGFMGFATIPNPLDDLYRSRKYDVERASGTCMLDPFTNRVVISNVSGSRFYTIFATKVATCGEEDSGTTCEPLEDVSTLWPSSPVEEEVSGSRFIDLEDEVTTEEEEEESSGQSSDAKTTV